jgi:hypothetical protein
MIAGPPMAAGTPTAARHQDEFTLHSTAMDGNER